MLSTMRVLFGVGTLALCTRAASPPAELFSDLIAQKVSAVASNLSSPALYPEYTDADGKWQYFVADTWTTGFFNSLLYALHNRSLACSDTQSSDGTLNTTDWLGFARAWTVPEVALETTNTLGHDVGFVSFPFQDELQLYVPPYHSCSVASNISERDPTNQTAIDAVNAFASDLAARFSPTVGCTRSWDTDDPTDFTVRVFNLRLQCLVHSASL